MARRHRRARLGARRRNRDHVREGCGTHRRARIIFQRPCRGGQTRGSRMGRSLELDAMLLTVYDAVMRLPLTVLAGYFLVREWQALEAAQGALHITAHVATMLFLALLAVLT